MFVRFRFDRRFAKTGKSRSGRADRFATDGLDFCLCAVFDSLKRLNFPRQTKCEDASALVGQLLVQKNYRHEDHRSANNEKY